MDLVVPACAPVVLQANRAAIAAPAKLPLTKAAPPSVIAAAVITLARPPVRASASAEAMVMQNARRDPPAGIEFDDVPFTGDADILVDDIIQPETD